MEHPACLKQRGRENREDSNDKIETRRCRPARHCRLRPCGITDVDVGVGAPPVDLSKWSPEYVRSIAGTEDFDTAAECGKVTPLDYKGRLTFWYQGVFEGDPDLLRQYYKDFFETFRKTYPNIQLEEQALTYNDLLDKFRTALLGNAGADGGPPADPGWHRVRLQGLSGAAQARGCRLVDRGFLARRHEGRHLGRA